MTYLRSLLTMLALLFAAVAISAPAAARGLHGFSHMAAPVASGEHHHHDGGGAATDGADQENAPQSDDSSAGKFGHSHMASSAFDVVPQIGGDLPSWVILPSETPAAANTPALGTLGWCPQIRPPRTA